MVDSMEEKDRLQPKKEVTDSEKNSRTILVASAFVLFSVILFSLVYLSSTPQATATMILAYAGGISNIFLPCTLPLVFVIVPISILVAWRKGLLMAILFGLGLTITLSIYGAVVAIMGQYLGLDSATRIMYALAGIASVIFGLMELKLININLPTYAGMPKFIEQQSDYLKVFLLGLLLGNAGVGCPNPITYVLLTFAATTGDPVQGALLMAMNGIGRATPLIFLVVLGILGVNALDLIKKSRSNVEKATAWALVLMGSFILLNGAFGHLWYEGGIFHEGLNYGFMKIGGKMLGEANIENVIEQVEAKVLFVEYGALANLLFTLSVVGVYYIRNPRAKKEVVIVAIIFLIWGLIQFNVGLNAHEILYGIEGG
ncbi:MAG: cytochrome c biogenesis protein CcdA [Candidatus Micrarchaeota archaeon]